LDSDGFLDISSGNGFFFAGFLELETLFERPFTWAAAREPATYNSSEPAPTVPDLRYWLGLAEQHQQEQALKEAQSEERARMWGRVAEWFREQRPEEKLGLQEEQELVKVAESSEERELVKKQRPAKKQKLVEVQKPSGKRELVKKRRPAKKQKLAEVRELSEKPELVEKQKPAEEQELVGSQREPYIIA
jgi:hypothetical protein